MRVVALTWLGINRNRTSASDTAWAQSAVKPKPSSSALLAYESLLFAMTIRGAGLRPSDLMVSRSDRGVSGMAGYVSIQRLLEDRRDSAPGLFLGCHSRRR